MKRPTRVSIVAGLVTVLTGVGAVFALNAQAAPTRYEAESAPATCDGTVATNHSGYSGAGFCDTPNATGAAVQFTVSAPGAGTATLGIRYANGSTADRPGDISVNGTVVRPAAAFGGTGAWNAWATQTFTVPLNAGSNTVRLAATTASGLANIDYLDVDVAGGPIPTPTATNPPTGGRRMESLGRGVVAVRSGSNSVLVSWRLLGLDPAGIGFNVYRSAGGGTEVKLNSSVLTGGTNYADTTANLTQPNTYRVRPVVNGVEQASGGAFTLPANQATEPVVRVPIRSGGMVKFLWVGDLDGDGEYDYVLDRQTSPQRIEAYRSNGQFLWSMNMGPNSTNQNNIEGGSSTINVGHNDGVTVYDLDSDGRAEVAVRIANGVVFGNGTTFTHSDNNRQFIAILDGMTGAPRATAALPTDYLSDGPMYARFGVGYLDGATPSLVAFMKNRIGSGGFNLMFTAWRFTGSAVSMQWKFLRGNQNLPDGHNTRIVDVDGNGTDEIAEIGFVLNGNGTLRYSLAPRGIVHGDRFHITKIDPNRAGLQGYGVQQDNPSGLREYYYDAATGNMIWQHVEAGTADVGRGLAGDIDPRHAGMEVWSFSGLYNAASNRLAEPNTSLRPWPQLGLYWDGDTGMELLNNLKFEKWDPNRPTSTSNVPRLLTASSYGAVNASQEVNPTFYGDILGDWREEVVYTNASYNQLIIFTTNQPSSTRLYTLAHNPAYRNAMTLKGYMQSHHVDYFLGYTMAPPPRPNIWYPGS
ncbi:carbohydrate-binding protein [Micromonospora sp. KC721]|uniref:rhamnogalacturonan lyase family protein n=1 Tax=Micromonospora sp. KC721 TaxID=2530380 RepID=UPI001051066C|nr:carbohydrate-binding protein [Micromonospora sp. KC721]TDB74224.1 carbohydrate-binding protein [Micromonospora sp. KC721]